MPFMLKKFLQSLALALIFASLFTVNQPAVCVAETTEADSSDQTSQPLPNRTTWENIAYYPTGVFLLPVKYSLKGLGLAVGYIDTTRISQRIDDFLRSDNGKRQAKPIYSNRTGFGASYCQLGILPGDLDQSILKASAALSPSHAGKFEAAFQRKNVWHDINAEFLTSYQLLGEEAYFGIGTDLPDTSKRKFGLGQTVVQGAASYVPLERLTTSFSLGYEFSYVDNADFDNPVESMDGYPDELAPGVHDQVGMIVIALRARWKDLDRPGHPTTGNVATADFSLYNESTDSRFGFVRYGFDAKHYQHLFSDRVLVLRFAAQMNNPFAGHDIPFYYLGELGREETVRGYPRGRFRHRDRMFSSVEYRYPIWHHWRDYGVDFALFADVGQVSPNIFSKIALDSFQPGFGFGFRLWDKAGLVSSLQFGFSDEHARVYLSINPGE